MRHLLTVALERLVLMLVNLVCLLWTVLSFIRRDWFAEVVFLVAVFTYGIIGACIHPNLMVAQLARGGHWDEEHSREGVLSEESYRLAKAVLGLLFLSGCLVTVMSLHLAQRWWALLHGVVAYFGLGMYMVLLIVITGLLARRRLSAP